MKIGFDAKRLFCNYTGLGNYSRTLLKNLHDFYPENDYYLFTPKANNNQETNLFFQDISYKIRMPETKFKSYWRTFPIKNSFKREGLDIYHGLSNEIPVNIQHTQVMSIVTIHDLIFKLYPETYKLFDRKIYDLKFRYGCMHADRIIAISENTKKDISELYQINPDKIDVIYQACNPIYYKLTDQQEIDLIIKQYPIPPDYLLSVGSVEARKNLKRVIESYQHLKKDLQIPLVVIGKGGKYKQESEQLARKAGLERNIIWINGLNHAEHLHAIYQNAKALIYPSYYEGFGLPVAEALLSKTPVITSGRSSLKEAGGPGSLYVDPDSSEQIAAAIEKVLTDSGYCKQMTEKGYQYAHQTFGTEKVTGEVMACYRRTLGRNHS